MLRGEPVALPRSNKTALRIIVKEATVWALECSPSVRKLGQPWCLANGGETGGTETGGEEEGGDGEQRRGKEERGAARTL